MAYTKDYWVREGGRIAKARRDRYATDPDYREMVKQRAKDYRDAKRAERAAFAASPTIEVRGEVRPALTIAALCAEAGITDARFKYLQKAGYLPPALVSRPYRLYTHAQAGLIRALDSFLHGHSQLLRMPHTERGKAAIAELADHLSTLKASWEN